MMDSCGTVHSHGKLVRGATFRVHGLLHEGLLLGGKLLHQLLLPLPRLATPATHTTLVTGLIFIKKLK